MSVLNRSGHTRTDTRPGDLLEYTATLCNSGTVACLTALFADLDERLLAAGIPAGDLDRAVVRCTNCSPPLCGSDCRSVPAAGSTLCRRGQRGSPECSWSSVATLVCGEDCASLPPAPDVLALTPVADSAQLIGPGECYNWTILAGVATTAAPGECLCVTAAALLDFLGSRAISTDPAWTSLAPGIGCEDAFTCPGPAGTCNTCVRLAPPATTCDLYSADLSFPPVLPPRTGDWVYTRSCGGAQGLPDLLVPASALPGDLPDDYRGPAGSLRLYQLDCGCALAIQAVKNPVTSRVHVAPF